MDFELLKTITAIPSTAGDEGKMRDYLVDYFAKNKKKFKSVPKVYSGNEFQDMVIVVFGKPRVAVFAHTDTVAFTVAYNKELMKIGNPKAKTGANLVGEDSKGEIKCTLHIPKSDKKKKGKDASEKFEYKFKRAIDPGTSLTYAPDFKETKNFVKSAYMDNRLGVWNAIQQAHTMENGALVFSTYEEHGGGGAQVAGKFLQDKYKVRQALISDVTLLSDYIKHKEGVAISMRDRGIPRQSYVRKVIALAKEHNIKFQLEVEKAGGSDGNSLQDSSYSWDWCFIGPPEDNYHQPGEKVFKDDIAEMVKLYEVLMEKL
ncbi:aminopeptidase [Cryomorpha ignava]|uniref:Aminopeptidase n=1 Tax=Cryomorpha ignava TaxID=101383 RepID=A0A7K3WWH7_9FLAO|nr:M20/M25/M40 family metallo-hydrolase [Cryomorpha ignava]NEN24965.1 aminopeptidase [Cryomorpha ignava]